MLIATLGNQLEPFAGSGRVVPWHRHAMPPEWGKNDAFNEIADVMLAIASSDIEIVEVWPATRHAQRRKAPRQIGFGPISLVACQ